MNRRARTFAILVLALGISVVAGEAPSYAQDPPAEDDGSYILRVQRSGARRVAVELRPMEVVATAPGAQAGARNLAARLLRDLLFSDMVAVRQPVPGDIPLPAYRRDLEGDQAETDPDAYVFLRLEGDDPQRMEWTGHVLESDGRTLAFGKRYTVDLGHVERAAHHFADEIVYHLTGQKGIAQTRIAFGRGQGEQREIYIVDYDGENLRQISRNGSINLSPRWSPAGNQLAYTSYYRGKQRLLILNGTTGKSQMVAEFPGLNTGASWSPDGDQLALTLSRDGNAEVYRVNLRGEVVQRLTFDPGIDCSPDFDPQGRQIVYTSDRTGVPQIYVMDVEGSNRRRLTYEGSYNESAAWSPARDRIAYVRREDGRFQVFTIEPDGSNQQRVTFPEDGNNEDPAWAPDGRHLVVSSDRRGSKDLWVIDVETGSARRLTRDPMEDTSPDWSGPPPSAPNP